MVPRALISKGSVFLQVQQLTCPPRRHKEDAWPLQETQETRVQPLGWEDSPGGGDGNFTAQFSMLVFSAFLVSLHRGAARFLFLERSSFPTIRGWPMEMLPRAPQPCCLGSPLQ